MEWIRETAKGILLPVRAVPRAAKNGIQGVYDNTLKIRPCAQISLFSGQTGKNKAFLITGLSKENLEQRYDEMKEK